MRSSCPAIQSRTGVLMKASKRESLSIASRLELEYEVLLRIIDRRVTAKNPTLGKRMEDRIIKRTLEELEEHPKGSAV